MSLIGLLVPVGVCAIKVALRISSNPTGSDWADAIDDFGGLFGKVKNELDRNRLSRHAAEMADEITGHLAREVEIEYPHLDEGDVAAAASEAVSALQRALPLTREQAADIVASEGSASAMYEVVAQGADIDTWGKQHGQDVAGLADLILRSTCHAIAAILRKRPDLSIDMLVLLVRRNRELAAVVDDVADALHDIPTQVAAATTASAQMRREREDHDFTTEYLRAVSSEYDRLELIGLDLTREVVHYELTTAYVSLRVTSDDSSEATTLQDALAKAGVLYLRGPAGSGKTTILQWLAVNAARRGAPRGYKSLNGALPVFVRLRTFADRPLPRVDELVRTTVATTLLPEPEGWLGRFARASATVLLLVDGVDEFPDRRAGELATWFANLAATLPNLRIVITGRPSAEAGARAIAGEFKGIWHSVDVQPMEPSEIRAFVVHWHRAVARRALVAGFGDQATLVADQLDGDPAYRRLAISPLICAALCALFHSHNGVLPGSRIETYGTLIKLLVADREMQKRVTVDPLPLNTKQRLIVLETLAGFMLENMLTELPKARAIACVERALDSIPVDVGADEVLDALLRRSGIIREPAPEMVDFVHRTFLEFLAAREYVRKDSVEALARHAADSNWAEAVVLAACLANETQYSRMTGVLSEMDKSTSPAAWAVRIMAGILATRATRLPSADAIFLDRLMASLPPRTGDEARALIMAGEQVFAFVAASVAESSANLPNSVPRSMINALGEFGGEAAFQALTSLPRSLRLDHVQDLANVWAWFDPERFARNVLSDLQPDRRTEIQITSSRLFPYLEVLSPKFDWDAAIEVPEDTLLTDCEGVRIGTLAVRGISILSSPEARRCGFVDGLVGPRALVLEDAPGFEVNGSNLGSLESLELRVVDGDADMSGLASSGELDVLVIAAHGRARLHSKAPMRIEAAKIAIWDRVEVDVGLQLSGSQVTLRGAPASLLEALILRRAIALRLHDVDDLENLETLYDAGSLRWLQVQDCPALENIEPLLFCHNLDFLEIQGHTEIRDAGALRELQERVPTVVLHADLQTLIGQESAPIEEYFNEFSRFDEIYDWGSSQVNLRARIRDYEEPWEGPDAPHFELKGVGNADREPSEDDLLRIEREEWGG
jgi:hypothetical protein